MKTKQAEIQPNSNNAQTQGFQAPIRAYLSKDGQYLTHVLPGGMRITKHVNFYKLNRPISYLRASNPSCT